MTDIIARRQFAPLYIWLDIAFLCVFLALLDAGVITAEEFEAKKKQLLGL